MQTLAGLFEYIRSIAFADQPKRLSKGQFILSGMLIGVASALIMLVVALLAKLVGFWIYGFAGLIVGLASLFFGIKNAIRRCHDLGLAGRYCWLFIIPLVNVVFGLFLIFKKGTIGENKYGADTVPLQDPSNTNYWILAIIFLLAQFVVSSFSGSLTKGYVDNMMRNGGMWGGMGGMMEGMMDDKKDMLNMIDENTTDNNSEDASNASGDATNIDEESSNADTKMDDGTIGVKECDDYVALLKCVISKTTGMEKTTYEQGFDHSIQLIKTMNKAYLQPLCQKIMDELQNQKDEFAKVGCTVE